MDLTKQTALVLGALGRPGSAVARILPVLLSRITVAKRENTRGLTRIPVILVLFAATAVAGEGRDFGPDGMKGLSAEQERDLADGKIVFSTTEAKGGEGSTLVEAALVLDKPPEYVWELLYRTEDQVNFLEEVEKLEIIEKQELQDELELTLKIVFMTFVYRVIHHFDEDALHIYWGLDPSFENDLLDLSGFWKLHPYGEDKTLARYGSRVSLKNVPQWVQSLFKRRGVEKSLVAVRKYINSGGTYRK